MKAIDKEYNYKLEQAKGNATIGLVYSGRIENFMPYWMDELCNDISFIKQKPQLIVINNSGLDLYLDNWIDKFSEIRVITGNSEIMNTIEKRPLLRFWLS